MDAGAAYCDVNKVAGLIACCLARNITFYACRYPGEAQARFGAQYAGTPAAGAAAGFRVVPFVESFRTPAFTIVPDHYACHEAALRALPPHPPCPYDLCGDDASYEEYIGDARALIALMRRGDAAKVVLARTITLPLDVQACLPQMFGSLCRAYPSACVFMVSCPGVCGWLGATPEVLLQSSAGSGYETMALAGTRPAGTPGEWQVKDCEEQQYVAGYIAQVLHDEGVDVTVSPTATRRAAQVEHLCTRFTINAPHDAALCDRLAARLHPTPAVAGIPVERARSAILATEQVARRYYSGYVGEAFTSGECRFFVNLRSLEFSSHEVRLYVGGGLTARSVAEDEWNETCIKSQTLLSVLNHLNKPSL